MLNTKILLVTAALLASIAGYEAYRHHQEVAREQDNKRFWDKVEVYRQREGQDTNSKRKATDALKYRVP